MLITNISNKYLKLTSDSITDFIANLSDYESAKLTGTLTCGTPAPLSQEVDAFAGNDWKFDLADAVSESQIISKIIAVNNATGKEFNVLTNNIDLGYVLANCSVAPCIMETHAGYFAPLFTIQIDDFFNNKGILTTMVATIVGSSVYLTGLPEGFSFKEISYVSSSPAEPAFYSNINSAVDGFFISNDAIYVKPQLFGLTSYIDGIYNISVKLVKADESGFILESNCYFLDILTKCRVAAYLVNILAESKVEGEDISNMVHLLHYGLVNGSNCGCNCEEMCYIYIELDTMLTAFNPKTDTNCGC